MVGCIEKNIVAFVKSKALIVQGNEMVTSSALLNLYPPADGQSAIEASVQVSIKDLVCGN